LTLSRGSERPLPAFATTSLRRVSFLLLAGCHSCAGGSIFNSVLTTNRDRKTVSDYMRLDETTRVELIQGEFLMTPSPTYRHQAIVRNLLVLLHSFVTRAGLGQIVPAPLDVILSEHDVVQPDLVFVAADHFDRIKERLHGPPDLAVEILSASNAERDRIVKRDLYRQYGVPEYWIVDPDAQTIEVLSLESGEWRLHGIFGKSEELASPILPGLRLSLEQVFV